MVREGIERLRQEPVSRACTFLTFPLTGVGPKSDGSKDGLIASGVVRV